MHHNPMRVYTCAPSCYGPQVQAACECDLFDPIVECAVEIGGDYHHIYTAAECEVVLAQSLGEKIPSAQNLTHNCEAWLLAPTDSTDASPLEIHISNNAKYMPDVCPPITPSRSNAREARLPTLPTPMLISKAHASLPHDGACLCAAGHDRESTRMGPIVFLDRSGSHTWSRESPIGTSMSQFKHPHDWWIMR
jgi:hypothetical protein